MIKISNPITNFLKYTKHTLLISIAVCSFNFVFASVSDSLINKLATTKQDTIRVGVLNGLCWELAYQKPKEAIRFGLEALQLSNTLHYQRGITKAYNLIGVVYDVTAKYDSALYYYRLALHESENLKDHKGIGSAYNNIGLTYWNKGNLDKAMLNYFKALREFQVIDDVLNIGNCYNNIGLIKWDDKKQVQALDYQSKALQCYEQVKDEHGIGACYSNLGLLYSEIKQPDSAIFYLNKSIVIKKKINDEYGLAIAYQNLGSVYVDLKQPEKALEYFLVASDYQHKTGERLGESYTLFNIAGVYQDLHNQPKQLEYLNKAMQVAQEIKSNNQISKIYNSLALYHRNTRNYKQAFDDLQKHISFKDSVYNEDSQKHIIEIETKYETEKKDLEIAKQTLELEKASLQLSRKRIEFFVLIAMLAMVILVSFLLYTRYKLKQKVLLEKEIVKQEALRNKAILEAEEKERIRIARDLHDGVGQKLSAVKMNLSAIDSKLQDENLRKKLSMITDLLDSGINEVRSVSHSMMPAELLKQGLAKAVHDLIGKLSNTIKIDLNIVGFENRFDSTTEAILFRVLQELMNNIIKHAKADYVSIQLIAHQKYISMMVEDNGSGFDTSSLHAFEGIGLKNMVSRIKYLYGEIDFDSAIGRGTIVNIEVPATSA